jgi:hypothetical protein
MEYNTYNDDELIQAYVKGTLPVEVRRAMDKRRAQDLDFRAKLLYAEICKETGKKPLPSPEIIQAWEEIQKKIRSLPPDCI